MYTYSDSEECYARVNRSCINLLEHVYLQMVFGIGKHAMGACCFHIYIRSATQGIFRAGILGA